MNNNTPLKDYAFGAVKLMLVEDLIVFVYRPATVLVKALREVEMNYTGSEWGGTANDFKVQTRSVDCWEEKSSFEIHHLAI
jgi:hypothetical protein